jgi:hypothetical protein
VAGRSSLFTSATSAASPPSLLHTRHDQALPPHWNPIISPRFKVQRIKKESDPNPCDFQSKSNIKISDCNYPTAPLIKLLGTTCLVELFREF